MSKPRIYFVSHARTTDVERWQGWYYAAEDEAGERYQCGPYSSREEAEEAAEDREI